jgi:hypothetical protein
MTDLQKALDYAHQHHDRFIEELKAIIAIRSIMHTSITTGSSKN